MNFYFRFSVVLVLLFSSSQLLFSQSEFLPALIINHQNDTIYGIGNMSKNQEYCLFKKLDAKEYTKYPPNEINVFRIINGKYYVSKEIKETNGMKWYFLELLVDGKIDLFSIQSSDKYFIQKENAALFELNDNIEHDVTIDGKTYKKKDTEYINYIKSYMSDAPQLFPRINELYHLNQRDLVNLSVDYHRATCNEYECINYTKTIPKVACGFELLSGATYHNSYYTPQVGLLIHIWRPIKSKQLYLKTGVIYSARPYWKKEENPTYTYAYNFKFPLSFQYVFGKNNFRPTIAFGCPTGIFLILSLQSGFIYSFSKKLELSVNASIDGLTTLPIGMHRELYNNPLGHSLNIGLIYNLKEK